jgi:Flp pilus assembly pilin Flp
MSLSRIRTHLVRDEGASSVEYALLIALIAGVIVLAVIFFGQSVKGRYDSTGSCVNSVVNCS